MARMTIGLLVLIALLGSPGTGHAQKDIESLRDALRSATDNAARGALHREIGDFHASEGDYRAAAESYAQALSLARNTFSLEDRTRFAVTMSWGGRIPEAVAELEAILAEDPSRRAARLHLARSLSWMGRIDDALSEAQKILRDEPENRDALLVKANALRWRGDCRSAVPVYSRLLDEEEDFDARLGLAYCRLSAGKVKEAREGLKRLAPKYPYQEKERAALAAAIAEAARPSLTPKYSYYSDTDDNRVHRYSVSAGYPVNAWRLELGYRHTDARDPARSARADDLSLSARARVSPRLGIGAGAGATRVEADDRRTFLSGHASADASVYGATVGVAVSRTVFGETARLLENGIRYTSVTTTVARPLPRGFALSGSHSYKDYSDDNASNDLQGALKYALRRAGPAIGVGYRIRYLDFDRESGGGYFDPSNYVAHQAFATLYYERGRVYTYLEPYYGHQSFTRTGTKTDDTFGGGSGLLGLRIAKTLSIEVTGEGGDYAAGAAAGFRYYLVGVTLKASF